MAKNIAKEFLGYEQGTLKFTLTDPNLIQDLFDKLDKTKVDIEVFDRIVLDVKVTLHNHWMNFCTDPNLKSVQSKLEKSMKNKARLGGLTSTFSKLM